MAVTYRHIIYIHFPYLAAARIRRNTAVACSPMVFIQPVNRGDRVVARCSLAARYGLSVGMWLADARVLCPTLQTHRYDIAADRADLVNLALWARRYAPLTACDHQANGIWIDVAGAEHLFGDVRGLMADCAWRLRQAGLYLRMSAAPTCGAAWAFSHYARPGTHVSYIHTSGRPSSVTPQESYRAEICQKLSPLPIAALRIADDVSSALQRTGLRLIGDIMLKPRAPLAARFGNDLLCRLDQACGDVQESFYPIKPVQPMIVQRHFVEPIAASSDIALMISYLADDTARLLYHSGMATCCLELGWQYVDGDCRRKYIYISRPSRDRALFQSLLAGISDSVNPEFGIEKAWMKAHKCCPLTPVTQAISNMMASTDDLNQESYANLIDRLMARLGYGTVVHLQSVASWQPEAAQQTVLPDPARYSASAKSSAWLQNRSNATASPRPIRLLTHPQRIDVVVLLPDHPPDQFVWQRCTYKIIKATGPERIAPLWWVVASGTKSRDYFRVQDDHGARFWLYREGLPERSESTTWFLHGFFA